MLACWLPLWSPSSVLPGFWTLVEDRKLCCSCLRLRGARILCWVLACRLVCRAPGLAHPGLELAGPQLSHSAVQLGSCRTSLKGQCSAATAPIDEMPQACRVWRHMSVLHRA